jgi:hypothetical protein
VYWEASARLDPDERSWAREIEDEYGWEITPEQMAWWRWMLHEKIGDMELMFQNHPPTAKHAFIASGSNFFSTSRLSEEMKALRKLPAIGLRIAM